jgi:hypothetical protein
MATFRPLILKCLSALLQECTPQALLSKRKSTVGNAGHIGYLTQFLTEDYISGNLVNFPGLN